MEECNDGLIITKDTWANIPKEQRDWIVFETMQRVNTRLQCLERWNKGLSFLGGIIGGVVAAYGAKWMG